eukprot:CAMPEP_0202824394 /NCGR_PEP_ID=MMETSP1389-20130828/12320_1 /ASSEMBLY_ACC=CAM_ASM_000865 /TAXON_ID=302021 /ORGANISM="Rhodomonas sp., Strain CCMP768" /LENGTH=57 /DNA_ID=CAMNT_0049497481 /DNA_START=70 /DNA_END=243 /DNA_ORIENTATION=-
MNPVSNSSRMLASTSGIPVRPACHRSSSSPVPRHVFSTLAIPRSLKIAVPYLRHLKR